MFLRQASFFLQEKYKTARLALTDVTQAQLLAEEATNGEPWGPDGRTMTRIADAASDLDDYCRIVEVLHRRFQTLSRKEWRQAYKALVLLEFLLTHGPEEIFEEFHCDIDAIRGLAELNHVDDRGFNWGACMKKRIGRILELLLDEKLRGEARGEALRISKEIQGFGNLMFISPTSSPTSSLSSSSPRSPSDCSPFDSPPPSKNEEEEDGGGGRMHHWSAMNDEAGSLIESNGGKEKKNMGGGFRSLSSVERLKKNNRALDRQMSSGF